MKAKKKIKKKSRKHVTIIHIHHSGIIGCQTQNKKNTQTQINTMIYFTPVGELLVQYYALVVYLTSEYA